MYYHRQLEERPFAKQILVARRNGKTRYLYILGVFWGLAAKMRRGFFQNHSWDSLFSQIIVDKRN